MLENTLRKIKETIAVPAQMVAVTFRASIDSLHDQYGIPEEQAAALVQSMLDDVFTEVTTVLDVHKEHPNWTEEMIAAEVKRRLKK